MRVARDWIEILQELNTQTKVWRKVRSPTSSNQSLVPETSDDEVPAKMAAGKFKPALIIVDMQNDFCPPVSHARRVHHLVYSCETVR